MEPPLLIWTTAGGTSTAARGNVEYRITARRTWFSRTYAAAAWEGGIAVQLGEELPDLASATAACAAEARVREESPPMQLLRQLQLQATSGRLEPMRDDLLGQWSTHRLALLGALRAPRGHFQTPGGCEIGLCRTGSMTLHRLVVPGSTARLLLIDSEWIMLGTVFARAIARALPHTTVQGRQVADMDSARLTAHIAADPACIGPFREWLFHSAMGVPSAVTPFALDDQAQAFAEMVRTAIEAFAVGRELSRPRDAEGSAVASQIRETAIEEFRYANAGQVSIDMRGAELSSMATQISGVPFIASWIGFDANYFMRSLSERSHQLLTTGAIVPSQADPEGPMRRWLVSTQAMNTGFPPPVLDQVLACRKLFMDVIEVLWGAAAPFLEHLYQQKVELPQRPESLACAALGTCPRA